MDRTNIIPVVCACIVRKGKSSSKVLLARTISNKVDADGKWQLPGGKIEYGESPESALIREIKEELNCEVRVERLLHVWSTLYKDGSHCLVLSYKCSITKGIPKSDNVGVGRLTWETITYISRMPRDTVLSGVLETVRKVQLYG